MLTGRMSDATAYVTDSDEPSDHVPANRREYHPPLHGTDARGHSCSRTPIRHLRNERDMQKVGPQFRLLDELHRADRKDPR